MDGASLLVSSMQLSIYDICMHIRTYNNLGVDRYYNHSQLTNKLTN